MDTATPLTAEEYNRLLKLEIVAILSEGAGGGFQSMRYEESVFVATKLAEERLAHLAHLAR